MKPGNAHLSVLIVATLVMFGACSSDRQANKVVYNMAWLPQGSQAGIIVAIELGYYEDLGLDVEAVRGFGGIRTVNEIDQGMFEFGYGGPLAVLLNRSNGGRTRMVGSINSRWPAGLCFVKERHNVREPSDLEGLTIGGGQNSPMQALVPLWLEQNGVSRDSINLLQMDPSVVDAALIEGTIDAGECWRGSNKAFVELRARESDVTVGWIEYASFGLDMYGSGVVTSDRMIDEHPEVVQAFISATYRGYAWVLEHPRETVGILVRRHPVLSHEITMQQVEEIIELIGGADDLGKLDSARMQHGFDFLTQAFDIDESVAFDDIYTSEFLK
jgi:NitT/TauT family transport system substrate-binding protein